MSPIKSTFGRSVGKLLGTYRNRDLSLSSSVKTDRKLSMPPITATGGSKSTLGSYTLHTFTSTQDFVVSEGEGKIEYIIIAGGGGGGGYGGGVFGAGGGAGGYRTNVPGQTSGGNSPTEPVSTTITPGTYAVVVGGGGASETNGSPSHFGPGTPFPVESIGGGYGGRGFKWKWWRFWWWWSMAWRFLSRRRIWNIGTRFCWGKIITRK